MKSRARRFCECQNAPQRRAGCAVPGCVQSTNPVPHLYALEATNPCGEQWQGARECCLGSINLAQHITPESPSLGGGRVDWDKLEESTVLSTHFLDNVVTANAYVPAVPQLREAAHRAAHRSGHGLGRHDVSPRHPLWQ
jgi:ribonucleotide reductase alpha subunit